MDQINPSDIHAFTNWAEGKALKLTNMVQVEYSGNVVETLALWDTGATGTCLSKGVVESLAMIPTGKTEMKTPSGKSEVNTYLVDLVLQNQVRITDVQVCESEIGDQGIGALVGMDIITMGDFAVSNKDGKTCFSFRIPSIERTDYVKQVQIANAIGQKHGLGKRKNKPKRKKKH